VHCCGRPLEYSKIQPYLSFTLVHVSSEKIYNTVRNTLCYSGTVLVQVLIATEYSCTRVLGVRVLIKYSSTYTVLVLEYSEYCSTVVRGIENESGNGHVISGEGLLYLEEVNVQ
jgi:hypothetical protein